jgi:hypothetical protein
MLELLRVPECEAKRQIGPESWQRVNIELNLRAGISATRTPCSRLRCNRMLAAQLGAVSQEHRGGGAVQRG